MLQCDNTNDNTKALQCDNTKALSLALMHLSMILQLWWGNMAMGELSTDLCLMHGWEFSN